MPTDTEHVATQTMTALQWRGRGEVRLEQVPVPEPAPDEALIAVEWVGLCGSDLEEYRDGPVVVPGPITLGHEIVGTVLAPAADGSGPPAGTPVVVDVVTGCGHCFWCREHNEGLCPDEVVIGLNVDGGLADLVAGRASRLIAVPPGLDLRTAALAEPTAVAVRAVRKLGVVAGRGVLIIGGGTIGLLTAQVLRHHGAAPILLVEPQGSRREIAADLGFEAVWSDAAPDRAATVAEHFPLRGADVVIECSGAEGAAAEAIRLVRAGGTAMLLSVTARDQAVDTTGIMLAEKTVIGSAAHMWDDDVQPAVQLLTSGAVRVDALISHEFTLTEGARAFEILADPTQNALKVLVHVPGA